MSLRHIIYIGVAGKKGLIILLVIQQKVKIPIITSRRFFGKAYANIGEIFVLIPMILGISGIFPKFYINPNLRNSLRLLSRVFPDIPSFSLMEDLLVFPLWCSSRISFCVFVSNSFSSNDMPSSLKHIFIVIASLLSLSLVFGFLSVSVFSFFPTYHPLRNPSMNTEEPITLLSFTVFVV